MSDLVQRLRTAADKADKIFDTSFGNPWREAAAEIERLRASNDILRVCLVVISRNPGWLDHHARAAGALAKADALEQDGSDHDKLRKETMKQFATTLDYLKDH